MTSKFISQMLNTRLTPDEEKRFQTDYAGYAKATGNSPNPDDVEHYYDYRGAWKQGQLTPDANSHLTGEFKKIGHPTYFAKFLNPNSPDFLINAVNNMYANNPYYTPYTRY